jgi:hypothetical protein
MISVMLVPDLSWARPRHRPRATTIIGLESLKERVCEFVFITLQLIRLSTSHDFAVSCILLKEFVYLIQFANQLQHSSLAREILKQSPGFRLSQDSLSMRSFFRRVLASCLSA